MVQQERRLWAPERGLSRGGNRRDVRGAARGDRFVCVRLFASMDVLPILALIGFDGCMDWWMRVDLGQHPDYFILRLLFSPVFVYSLSLDRRRLSFPL